LPVIASDIPGINNFIEQGKTGLLFRSQNPRDLSDKINYLLDNKNLAKALVQEGRKLVEENYSSLQMFNQYRKLILN
jgi:glycosyltransferase involved in cell wall biosynthesis